MAESELIISGPGLKFKMFQGSLGEFLLEKFKLLRTDDIAQIDGETGEEQTVEEFLRLGIGVAESFLKLGLKPGVDIVPLIANYSWESMAVAIGGALSGVPIYPIDPSLTAFEFQHLLVPCKSKIILCEKRSTGVILDALNSLQRSARIYLLDDKKNIDPSFLKFADILKEKSIHEFVPPKISTPADTPILIAKSSGATGLPKPVMITHKNIIFQLQCYELLPSVVKKLPYLQIINIHWILGITAVYATCFGVKNIFLRNVTPTTILKAADSYIPEWTFASPAMVTKILSHPDFLEYDVSSFQSICVGESMLPKSTVERFKEQWPVRTVLCQVYGITELTGGITLPSVDDIYSVGKLKADVQLKIVHLTTGKILGPNQTGEIRIKSRYLIMKGYLDNEEATKQAFDEAGFYKTGDLGYYLKDGRIYIIDRIREFIMCKNNRISPSEIENFILKLPGVADVAVVGVPHEIDLYHTMALVVKQPNSEIKEEDIINYVAENLSEEKYLYGGVKIVHSIPRTANGKIKRHGLKKLI